MVSVGLKRKKEEHIKWWEGIVMQDRPGSREEAIEDCYMPCMEFWNNMHICFWEEQGRRCCFYVLSALAMASFLLATGYCSQSGSCRWHLGEGFLTRFLAWLSEEMAMDGELPSALTLFWKLGAEWKVLSYLRIGFCCNKTFPPPRSLRQYNGFRRAVSRPETTV